MSIKQKTTNTGKDMGKEQPLFTACGRAKCADTMGISVEVLQKKKIKIELSYGSLTMVIIKGSYPTTGTLRHPCLLLLHNSQ